MICLFCRDNRSIAGEHEVDTRVGHEVGLEFGDVHIESSIETQRRGQRGDDLCQQAVQICVGWALDVKIASADIIQCLIVIHDSHICVFEQRMHTQNGIVRFYYCSCNLRACPNREAQLRLLAVIDRKTLEHQTSESAASSTSNCIEDHETLQACAIVCEFTDTVKNQINNFFANRVMTACEVVGCIFFSCDELLWMEQLAIGASADFVNDGRFQVYHDTARNMFTGSCL